jgi:transposase-like protein
MKEKEDNFNMDAFKAKALAGLQNGQPMMGEDGVLAPLMKHLLESCLEGEMDSHLAKSKSFGYHNRRNGKSKKQVRGLGSGEFELETPRDRNGSFVPKAVGKRQVIITEGLEEKVISLYAMGGSYRDISSHIQELYAMELSPAEITSITDKVIPAMQEWRNRPLESLYCFLFMDCIHYKVRKEGKVSTIAIYNLLGIDQYGKKDLLGMYTSENEGATFWLSVLTDLKNRGVEDVLIACVDGLKGFPEAIGTVFPKAEVQLCIIHQIRTSLRYVTERDKKAFMADLKCVYRASSEEEGFSKLGEMEEKWSGKFPLAIRTWYDHWEHLSPYFSHTPEVRRIMYTTNIIEGVHRQMRKVTKSKGAFSSENALLKLLYLASMRIIDKWTMPLPNWPLVFSQLYLKFEERVRQHLRE